MTLQEIFKKQIENTKVVTKEDVDRFTGKSRYSDYQVGDKMLIFLILENKQEYGNNPNHKVVELTLSVVVERDFDEFNEEFEFVGMHSKMSTLPVFKFREHSNES